jgi:hypothetical protein
MARAPLRHSAKELGSVVAALLCMLFISAVTSFANAGLDFNKLWTAENITNMCLNASITIFGTIVAIPLGVVKTKQLTTSDGKPGRYIGIFAAYQKIRADIEHKRLEFSQWHIQKHREEQYRKCLNYLLSHNIVQAEDVMKLSREQILLLTTSQKFTVDGTELYFKALTHEQIRACNDVLSGRVVVHKLPDFYFLYVDGKSKSTFYDQAHTEARDNAIYLITRLAYKVFIGFVITSIFTSLIISKLSEDVTTREYVFKALITIFARLFNAISSIYWGYQIGQEQVYRQCYYISGKTQFLELFNADVTFVAKDLQELARQDYEESKGDVADEAHE